MDDTLEVSRGPVPIDFLRTLRRNRDIVVICGNWKVLVTHVPDWWEFISTMGPDHVSKDYPGHKMSLLRELKTYLPGKRGYIMVGNKYIGNPQVADDVAARQAGWTFLVAEEWQRLL